MAAPDFKTVIETIRDHSEITEIIGSYIQLKKAGRALKACCPFHNEKTPSFNVNPSRQTYHCFGCGAGGDVFSFVMRYENLEFMEAARLLAERANLPFEFDRDASPAKTSRKKELYDLHAQLAPWYVRCLNESGQAAKARAYLEERSVSPESVEAFGIGYAPARGVNWEQWARKRKFDMSLLEEAGIVIRRDHGGWYDRFADRLMFPIHDESGRVIGFSGRILPGDERPAKYVNSPETPLFTKSRVIYGLHQAKRNILDANEAILCEGQLDVIRCHTAGFGNAVAAQGTAVTEQHAKILKRLADSVRLVFDSDNAGQNAAIRTADVMIETGLQVHVTRLPDGEDPDSLIRREGPEAFRALLAAAVPSLDFQVATLMGREDTKDDAALLRVARAVLESIARTPSAIQREQMLQHAASLLGIRPDILESEFKSAGRTRTRQRVTDIPDTPAPAPTGRIDHPPEELELIRILIHYPEAYGLAGDYIEPDHFRSAACRILFELVAAHADEGQLDFMALLPAAASEERRLVAMLSADDRLSGTEFNLDRAVQELILAIRRKEFERQRRELENRRREAPPALAGELELEIAELTLNQHTLRSGWEKAKWMLDIHRSLRDTGTGESPSTP